METTFNYMFSFSLTNRKVESFRRQKNFILEIIQKKIQSKQFIQATTTSQRSNTSFPETTRIKAATVIFQRMNSLELLIWNKVNVNSFFLIQL